MILILGKARSHRTPSVGCMGSESPGWLDILPKNSSEDMMHVWVHCHDEAVSHQLPVAVAFWIIWIVSMEECSTLIPSLMQIRCSTCSVILNVMLTQQCLQWPPLVQWSHHCLHMCIPVHSPWLPGYIDVTQTILIILTLAWLFLERPYIPNYCYVLIVN